MLLLLVGVTVDVYTMVGITPRSEKRRSGNARSVKTCGAVVDMVRLHTG